MNRRAFLAGAAAFAARPARGEEAGDADALAGDRFAVGAEEFQLADILAPSAFALHADAEPYFDAARAELQRLLAGQVLDIEDVAQKTRWGARVVGAQRRGDGAMLQERLVEAGAARVAPQTEDVALIDRLLAAEAQARAERRGLWGLDAYRVFDARAAEDAIGAFHLVEGEVLRAALARGRFYLNFGADYRTDFTATARAAIYRRWSAGGFDLAGLEGARLRVRGFVIAINGPSIDLTHARRIEILQAA